MPFEKYEGKRFQKGGLGRVGVVTLSGSSGAEGFTHTHRERERERGLGDEVAINCVIQLQFIHAVVIYLTLVVQRPRYIVLHRVDHYEDFNC